MSYTIAVGEYEYCIDRQGVSIRMRAIGASIDTAILISLQEFADIVCEDVARRIEELNWDFASNGSDAISKIIMERVRGRCARIARNSLATQ